MQGVWKSSIAVGMVVTVILAGCSSSRTGNDVSSKMTPAGVSPLLTASTWTDGEWPFTVPEGVLKCYVQDSMVTFTANGVEYGLNNTAKKFGAFQDINEISPGETSYIEINGERERVDTNRKDQIPMLSRAERLCPPITVKPN